MFELINKVQAFRILHAALVKFGGRDKYEYKMGGVGLDDDGNGVPEIDCSHMVYEALKEAGLKIPYGYVQTGGLNSPKANNFFGQVDPADVVPGDLIVFREHVGIVINIRFDKETNKYRGSLFHSESHSKGPTTNGFVIDPSTYEGGYKNNYYGSIKAPITKFLRPKRTTQKAEVPSIYTTKWQFGISPGLVDNIRKSARWSRKTITDCTKATEAKWQKLKPWN